MRALVFRTHQQKWRQPCFILYILFVLLPHNLRQLPFSPPPPLDHAATILDCVSVLPGETLLPTLSPPLPLPISYCRLSPPSIFSSLTPLIYNFALVDSCTRRRRQGKLGGGVILILLIFPLLGCIYVLLGNDVRNHHERRDLKKQ